MNRKMQDGRRGARGVDANDPWAQLIGNDVAGIDGDIERLVGLYQTKYGYTHDKASAELVRRLSGLGALAAPRMEEACC
jgi:uncharacterized protein YjbJ (UPF0337 family)